MAKRPRRTKKDLVLAVGRTDDGDGAVVLRSRRDHVELGEMRPLKEGRPIQGEVVRLERRPELPMLFDAETLVEAPERSAALPARSDAGDRHGPAQVASAEYRKNWDTIWRRRSRRDLN